MQIYLHYISTDDFFNLNNNTQIYLSELQDTSNEFLWPSSVIRVLRSKACRNAIMFGDVLALGIQ